MILYRMASPEHINKLDGKGAERHGQRWNPRGVPALYAATSASLAFVEKLANHSPADLMLATIELSGNPFFPRKLPSGWNHLGSFLRSQPLGEMLLGKHLAFSVPSVVISFDRNVILSPSHQRFSSSVRIINIEQFIVDSRIMVYLKG